MTERRHQGSIRPLHAYLAHFRVRHHQLDPLGHVNNAAYLNFLEQAAIDHAAAAGFDVEHLRAAGGLFVVRRHEIDFLRPAAAGDVLRVATWPVEIHGARAVRAYEVRRCPPLDRPPTLPADALVDPAEAMSADGETIVRARTAWAFVDPESGRPRRIPTDVRAAFVREADIP